MRASIARAAGAKKLPSNLYIYGETVNLTDRKLPEGEISDIWENGAKIIKQYTRGCSQVSNSGPVLWNVVSNSSLQLDLGEKTYIQAYADDFILSVTEDWRDTLQIKAKEMLKALTI